jgi:hypothetical protein
VVVTIVGATRERFGILGIAREEIRDQKIRDQCHEPLIPIGGGRHDVDCVSAGGSVDSAPKTRTTSSTVGWARPFSIWNSRLCEIWARRAIVLRESPRHRRAIRSADPFGSGCVIVMGHVFTHRGALSHRQKSPNFGDETENGAKIQAVLAPKRRMRMRGATFDGGASHQKDADQWAGITIPSDDGA